MQDDVKTKELQIKNPVILFDGLCNLCNGTVRFIIKRDKKKQFRFASLQGNIGQQVLQQINLHQDSFDSFLLLKEGKIYSHSTAVLKVVKELSGLWPSLYLFILFPPFLRNAIYHFIASHRYQWFGKKETCSLPSSPAIKEYFLDHEQETSS
jgi:predicted DCC family thiol-disulfide oxidoreductase YuxK